MLYVHENSETMGCRVYETVVSLLKAGICLEAGGLSSSFRSRLPILDHLINSVDQTVKAHGDNNSVQLKQQSGVSQDSGSDRSSHVYLDYT